MSPSTESQNVVADRPEKPARRASRILSERSVARRKKLVAQLVEPTVVAEDVELLTDTANSIYLAFKPRNGWQDWLTSTVATIMVRLNRCERIERKLRDLASFRAIDLWEEDQTVEVETLASRIDRDPAKVVAKLRQTPAGLDWLLRRWRFLAKVDPRTWTDDQKILAGRLAGGDPEVDATEPGFAADFVAELESLQTRVEEADAIVRGLVEADLADHKVPGLSTLRRYARSLHRQLKWYVDQFHVEHPDRWDDPRRKPAFEVAGLTETRDSRATHWSFADSEWDLDKTKPITAMAAEPQLSETKPFAAGHDFAETNPTATNPEPENDETNPLLEVERDSTIAKVLPQVVIDRMISTRDRSLALDSDSARKRRPDPVQEAARRRKAARRRAAMACGSEV